MGYFFTFHRRKFIFWGKFQILLDKITTCLLWFFLRINRRVDMLIRATRVKEITLPKYWHYTHHPIRTTLLTLEMTIFGLKMIVKSGLEFFYFVIEWGLSELLLPSAKNRPRKAELAWQVSRYLWRGSFNFKIKNSEPLFTIILSQKWSFQELRV